MEKKQTLGLSDFLTRYLVILIILGICVYTAIMNPDFLNPGNLLNILRQASGLGIVAVGMTIAIIGGYTDLSLPGLISLEGMVLAISVGRMSTGAAILLTLAIGLVCGAVNGILVVGFGAETGDDALFITYGMSMAYLGITCILNTSTISLGSMYPVLDFIGRASIGFLPVTVMIFLIVVIVAQVLLSKTMAGKSIHMLGGNRTAARLSGINKNKYTMLMFVLVGLFTAIGAIVIAARVASVNTSLGKNFDANALTATVIGGTSLSGGHGGAVNTLLGAIFVQLLSNAMNMLGFDSNLQYTLKGIILVLVIVMDSIRTKRGAAK